MSILALDTATEACSVAWLCKRRAVRIYRELGRGHAEQILGMVDTVLGEAGVGLEMLDGIAASVGPGAFTGVRICISVAQGLAFGANLRVVGISTLEALAMQAVSLGAAEVLACLDARLGEVYWACFRATDTGDVECCGELKVGKADSVRVPFAGAYHGIGRGFAAYPGLRGLPGLILQPDAELVLPDAFHMARLGEMRLAAGGGMDPAALTPLYLRNTVALTEAQRAAGGKLAAEPDRHGTVMQLDCNKGSDNQGISE